MSSNSPQFLSLITCHLSIVPLLHDIRFSLRMLYKNYGITIFAILALAIGIGANTALFSLIHGILLSPLPFPEPDRLMWVTSTRNGQDNSTSGPDYLDLAEQNTVFDELCALQAMCRFNVTGQDTPIAVFGFRVTTNFFDVMTVNDSTAMVYGRKFRPEESQWGKRRIVILSYRLWVSQFDSSPDIVGNKITIDEEPYEVIGVAKPTMGFLEEMAQLYIPFVKEELTRYRDNHFLQMIGRLKSNVPQEQAQAELSIISHRLTQEYPDSNKNYGTKVFPLHEALIRDVRPAFFVLYGAVGFLLLMACVNVANLLLAKSGARAREIAIRNALGAGRFRIVRQILTESIVLAIAGGILGLFFSFWGLDLIQLIAPKWDLTGSGIPGFEEIDLNPTVLVFTLLLSLGAGLLFGMVPAWQTSNPTMNETLKESGRGGGISSSRHRILSCLIVAEIALALTLLMGGGLLIKSFYHLQKSNPGFDPNSVLAVQMELPKTVENQENINRCGFYQNVIKQITSLPGVETAGVINVYPLSPYNISNGFTIEGRPPLPKGEFITAEYRTVSRDYFRTLKIPLLSGRFFEERDNGSGGNVMIVDAELVRRYFSAENPIGQRIQQGGRTFEIVGVVGSTKDRSLKTESFSPMLYEPIDQHCWHMMTVVLRTQSNPVSLANAVRQEIRSINPNQPIFRIHTMNQAFADSISVPRFCAILLCSMAGVALLLAMIGIYGVMSFSVNERSHEIGIRIALGAQMTNILSLILKKGMILTFAGVMIGLLGSFALSRVMVSMLYNISATDPFIFVGVSIILTAVAFIACYFPACKAAKVDPIVTLRCE